MKLQREKEETYEEITRDRIKVIDPYETDPRDMTPRVCNIAGRRFVLWRDDDGWWHHFNVTWPGGPVDVSAGYPSTVHAIEALKEDLK